jgi:hypothetical protein
MSFISFADVKARSFVEPAVKLLGLQTAEERSQLRAPSPVSQKSNRPLMVSAATPRVSNQEAVGWLTMIRPNRPVALYSMTSSARVSRVGGTVTPSVAAVLRLIASSNLVGCITGRSEGFSPLRTRPV